MRMSKDAGMKEGRKNIERNPEFFRFFKEP
jgi:hypothetical protein